MRSPSRTAVVILAAEGEQYPGQPTQLLPFNGLPLVRHAAQAGLDSGLGPVLVVLGAHEDRVRPALFGLDVRIVSNERWCEGVGTSIAGGIEVAGAYLEVVGAVLTRVDQPLITAGHLRNLATVRSATRKPIVASRYGATAGVPAYFSRELFPALMALTSRHDCSHLILSAGSDAVLLDCPEAELDLDRPGQHSRLGAVV